MEQSEFYALYIYNIVSARDGAQWTRKERKKQTLKHLHRQVSPLYEKRNKMVLYIVNSCDVNVA
jgi:hypothetical protein